jgi:murein L,D-transpeptidase YcbB/YkuD
MRWFWTCVLAGAVSTPPMHIVINIPAYRLDVYDGDSLARTMPIAVGMARYRSPRGSFAITNLEWNPLWIPPNSPWAAKEKPMGPGPANPMGRVKLNFRPLYYVHGTPLSGSIGSAASHGCIRMLNRDALELARIVSLFGLSRFTADSVDQLVADTVTTRTLVLEQTVPVEIRYDLVELRSGRVNVYQDIYGLATRSRRDDVYALLASQGIDTTRIDPERVRALVRGVPRAGSSTLVDSLLRAPEW